MDAGEAPKNALECGLEAKKGESIIIFCDDEKMDVGQAFAEGAVKLELQTRLVQLKTGPNCFRKEIPQQLMETLTRQTSDVYINLLRGIREETPFRIKLIKMETRGERSARGGVDPIKVSVEITVKNGKAQDFSSVDTQVLRRVKDSLNTDAGASVVGEFAFGINSKARFVEEFLEAEKMLGTVHIAFGDNSDMLDEKTRPRVTWTS